MLTSTHNLRHIDFPGPKLALMNELKAGIQSESKTRLLIRSKSSRAELTTSDEYDCVLLVLEQLMLVVVVHVIIVAVFMKYSCGFAVVVVCNRSSDKAT